MSDRITWATCPRCGGSAAVGWQTRIRPSGEIVQEPVEFDCSTGCEITELQMLHWFGCRTSGSSPD